MNQDDKTTKGKKFADFLSKATDASKKVAASVATNVQEGASNLSEKMKQDSYERRLKKYNPLFAKEFKSKSFKLPEIIKIDSDQDRKNIDVCQGAIGWRETTKHNHDVLYLYKDFAEQCGIRFIPEPSVGMAYFVDKHEDVKTYIDTDLIFSRAKDERLAELENIAYSLGAKSCYIEIIESDAQIESTKTSVKESYKNKDISAEASSQSESTRKNSSKQSGKAKIYFDGSDSPKRPELKWFKNDRNILNLIEMRCSNANSVKSKVLELEGATSATMSDSVACSIDLIKQSKTSVSVQKQASKEQYSKLIFEVEF